MSERTNATIRTAVVLAVMALVTWAAMRFAEWLGLGNMLS
jgi:hypothetical protein